jgi:hypothetical protein
MQRMILSMLVRRLRPGVTLAEFKQAWMAEPNHFGRPVRVSHARRLDDPREIVSFALLDVSAEDVQRILERPAVLRQEQERHRRIDDVIEATVARGLYEVVDTTELS